MYEMIWMAIIWLSIISVGIILYRKVKKDTYSKLFLFGCISLTAIMLAIFEIAWYCCAVVGG